MLKYEDIAVLEPIPIIIKKKENPVLWTEKWRNSYTMPKTAYLHSSAKVNASPEKFKLFIELHAL